MPKKKVDKVYQKKIEDIKVDGEKFADSAMKLVYLEQKAAMVELQSIIGKAYLEHSKDGAMVLTTAQQKRLMTRLRAKLKEIGLKLGKNEVEKVTSTLAGVFSSTYYQNAFVLESGLRVNLKFTLLKKEFVSAAVNAKYKGELFSDRIWANKALMIDRLQSNLTDAVQGKTTIDKVGRTIRDQFNVTAYESSRLVRTENARIQSQAIDDIARSAGVAQQMYSATLDEDTNPEDASYDGTIYSVDDPKKPGIPLHPNCRCVYINVPYEGWSPTARKDNATKGVVAYTNYEDWAKAKGIK